jgi:4-hydroxy-tetrahydrodipicolinate synthase
LKASTPKPAWCATAWSRPARPSSSARPSGTPQAYTKYWMELLGQVGGPVRRPLLNLTEAEKAATRDALARSGLRLS